MPDHCGVEVGRKNGDKESDQAPAGRASDGRHQDADAAEDLACAGERDEAGRPRQPGGEHPGIYCRHVKVIQPREDEEYREEPAEDDPGHFIPSFPNREEVRRRTWTA